MGSTDFLRWYGLDENSHRMDWFTAFMPQTPNNNMDDPAVANVKGDCRTKFAILNWTAYSNTKAMMAGAGDEAKSLWGSTSPS